MDARGVAHYRQGMRKAPWLIVTVVVLVVATAGLVSTASSSAASPWACRTWLAACFTLARSIEAWGKGYHRSPIYLWGTRRCRGCVGGLQVRHGARVVGLPHIKAEHEVRTRTIKKNRRARTWR